MPSITKGIRLNNPGNIEHGEDWQGLADVQPDKRFCAFVTPEYGIRALCKILQSYNKKYKITTIDGIINRWAPSHENPTDAYCANVSKWSGYGRTEKLDFKSRDMYARIAKAITRQENGICPYLDATVYAGVDLALTK